MSAPAGPCEWCGGQQSWTIISGDMFVRCSRGCMSLDLEELVPPHPISEDSLITLKGQGEGTILRMGGVSLEGGSAPDDGLPF